MISGRDAANSLSYPSRSSGSRRFLTSRRTLSGQTSSRVLVEGGSFALDELVTYAVEFIDSTV
jgi:hypothetical protein